MGDPRKDRARKKRLRRRDAAWRRRRRAKFERDMRVMTNIAVALMLDPEVGVLPPTLTTSRVAEIARTRLLAEVAFDVGRIAGQQHTEEPQT